MKRTVAILIPLCLLLACVPTPEEAVINRADGALDGTMIDQSKLPDGLPDIPC